MSRARLARCWRPLFLVTLLVLAASGCAGPGDDGAGGTGIRASGDGIGGTGVTASGDGIGGTGITASGDGIGGTGAQTALDPDGIGGTGIVGVVSALGSVYVNGLHVVLPAGVAVTRNGSPTVAAAVARGQVVAIVARQRNGALEATDLQILDALRGPVQHVDLAAGLLQVMGQTLRIDPERVVMERLAGGLGDVMPGERVLVSGLWRADGVLQVTRIDAAEPSAPAFVFGPVTGLDQTGLRVGPLRVIGTGVEDAALGQYVRATGVADGGTLRANAFTTQPLGDFQQRVKRLVVEAYPGLEGGVQVSLGPLRASIPAATQVSTSLREAAASGERVVVDARVISGRVEIDTIRPTDRAAPASRLVPMQDTPRVQTDAVPRPETPAVETRPQIFERPPSVDRPVRPEPIERPVRPDAIERPLRPDLPRDIRPVDARSP